MFKLDERLANDTIHLGDLNLSRVLLMNDSQYPWIILVPVINDVSEIHQLDEQQRSQLAYESNAVASLMDQEFSADKMNIAALGNVVAQLHIHHVARFQSDKAWPAPVWGAYPTQAYQLEALNQMVERLQLMLSKIEGFQAI